MTVTARPYHVTFTDSSTTYRYKRLAHALKVAVFQSGKHPRGVTTLTNVLTGEVIVNIVGLSCPMPTEARRRANGQS